MPAQVAEERVGVEPHCERVAFLGGLFQALDGAVGLAQSQPACGKLTGGNIARFRRSAQPGKTAAGDIRLSAQTANSDRSPQVTGRSMRRSGARSRILTASWGSPRASIRIAVVEEVLIVIGSGLNGCLNGKTG